MVGKWWTILSRSEKSVPLAYLPIRSDPFGVNEVSLRSPLGLPVSGGLWMSPFVSTN